MNILKKILKWFKEEEGMTWERYHRNMESEKKRKERD
tara:strand:- start:6465 stop:6575 length:111 start_codon:yes stop_codon:yes gene_type:complete